MLRLPSIRGELQTLYGHDTLFRDLAMAYGEAAEMLDKLRSSPYPPVGLLNEYQAICDEVEEEIVRRCKES
jgi:hypothetical protein